MSKLLKEWDNLISAGSPARTIEFIAESRIRAAPNIDYGKKEPKKLAPRAPALIHHGSFRAHSGAMLRYEIDCTALSDETIFGLAQIIAETFEFSDVWGIPRGGTRLAEALKPFTKSGFSPLIVDDVLTTGDSMVQARKRFPPSPRPIGVVIFNRSGRSTAPWIWPIFTVAPWTQKG